MTGGRVRVKKGNCRVRVKKWKLEKLLRVRIKALSELGAVWGLSLFFFFSFSFVRSVKELS